jgi:hypothetical protein
MSANPQVVAVDTTLFWDGVTQRLPRGTVLDVAPNSALLAAIGREHLVPLGATSALPPEEPPAKEAPTEKPPEEAPAAPPKPVTQAKKQDTETAPVKSDDKGGDS